MGHWDNHGVEGAGCFVLRLLFHPHSDLCHAQNCTDANEQTVQVRTSFTTQFPASSKSPLSETRTLLMLGPLYNVYSQGSQRFALMFFGANIVFGTVLGATQGEKQTLRLAYNPNELIIM